MSERWGNRRSNESLCVVSRKSTSFYFAELFKGNSRIAELAPRMRREEDMV